MVVARTGPTAWEVNDDACEVAPPNWPVRVCFELLEGRPLEDLSVSHVRVTRGPDTVGGL